MAAATTATTIALIAGSDSCGKHRFGMVRHKTIRYTISFLWGVRPQLPAMQTLCNAFTIFGGYGKHYYYYQWPWLGNRSTPSITDDAFEVEFLYISIYLHPLQFATRTISYGFRDGAACFSFPYIIQLHGRHISILLASTTDNSSPSSPFFFFFWFGLLQQPDKKIVWMFCNTSTNPYKGGALHAVCACVACVFAKTFNIAWDLWWCGASDDFDLIDIWCYGNLEGIHSTKSNYTLVFMMQMLCTSLRVSYIWYVRKPLYRSKSQRIQSFILLVSQ